MEYFPHRNIIWNDCLLFCKLTQDVIHVYHFNHAQEAFRIFTVKHLCSFEQSIDSSCNLSIPLTASSIYFSLLTFTLFHISLNETFLQWFNAWIWHAQSLLKIMRHNSFCSLIVFLCHHHRFSHVYLSLFF